MSVYIDLAARMRPDESAESGFRAEHEMIASSRAEGEAMAKTLKLPKSALVREGYPRWMVPADKMVTAINNGALGMTREGVGRVMIMLRQTRQFHEDWA
ncbi:MAG: hypothetical protein AAF844_00225 [Pseudomonadota bacterium]